MFTGTHTQRIAAWLIGLVLIAGNVDGAPLVYQDDYLAVRAGIAEAGTAPIHAGDLLTLVVELEFDHDALQPQRPDAALFQRSFAELPALVLAGEPRIDDRSAANGRRQLLARWQFQVLDCPEMQSSCPGTRDYALPPMTLGYQLGNDDQASQRSASFRPWPGSLTIVPAVSEPGDDTQLAAIIPAGAWPLPDERHGSNLPAWLIAAAGVLLAAVGLWRGAPSFTPSAATVGPANGARWQQVLQLLQRRQLSAEVRADLLRRSVTWYCLDVLRQNPYAWFREAHRGQVPEDLQSLFFDVLQCNQLDSAGSEALVQRFNAIVGAAAATP